MTKANQKQVEAGKAITINTTVSPALYDAMWELFPDAKTMAEILRAMIYECFDARPELGVAHDDNPHGDSRRWKKRR